MYSNMISINIDQKTRNGTAKPRHFYVFLLIPDKLHIKHGISEPDIISCFTNPVLIYIPAIRLITMKKENEGCVNMHQPVYDNNCGN